MKLVEDHAATMTPTINDRPERLPEPSGDGRDGDLPVVVAGVQSRQEAVEDAGNDVSPLLGIELTSTEKAGENWAVEQDSNLLTRLAPLLGTSTLHIVGNAKKSSSGRSSQRVRYTELLHNPAAELSGKPQKTVPDGLRGCYTNLLHKLPVGMSMRGSRFYYRRRLPSDVQRLTGKAEVWRSLRTDSLKVALRRLPCVAARLESEFEHARLMAGLSVDSTLIQPFADDQTERPATMLSSVISSIGAPGTPPTLGEAYQRYIDDPTRSWSPSTREAYETSRKLAIAVIGEEVPIGSVCRAHCRELLDVLRFLPTNAGKRFPRLSPREAADRARLRGDIQIISAANANSLMSNTSSFLNWAVNEELISRNPARGLRLPDAVAKRDKRLPFTPAQLRTIFNAPLYRGCVDGERGYSKSGNEHPRNARFWVPLIGLHTGARLGEICQLDVADVRAIDGVMCFVISERSLVGSTDKRLKTGASDRIIPLHPNLIGCGLLHFVEEKRRTHQAKLFGDIKVGTTGSRSVAFSKWFTQFLRACGAQQHLTCYHSFRHVFRDELRAARIEHDVAMLLGGWVSGSSRNGISENYGSGHGVEVLHEAICKLKFHCVSVDHLTTLQANHSC